MNKNFFRLALAVTLALSCPLAMAADKTTQTIKETHMTTQTTTRQPATSMTTATKSETAQYAPEAQQAYLKGQLALIEKRYPEAIESFEKALASEPEYTVALEGLAQTYYARGEYDKALTNVQKAIEINPLYSQLTLDKARILDAQKKEGGALEGYLTFLSLNPYDSSRLDIQRRSADLYDKWAGRMNENQKAYFNGLRALAMDNPEQAVVDLKTFINSNGQTAQTTPSSEQVLNAHRLLGLAYQELNRPTDAIAVLEVITKQQPQNAVPFYHLSNAYQQAGKTEQAKQAWTSFVKNTPNTQAYQIERYYIQEQVVAPTTR